LTDVSTMPRKRPRRQRGDEWQPQADAYLTKEWAKGIPARAIGHKLGRSPTAVRSRVKTLKLTPRYSFPVKLATDPVLRPQHTKRFEQFSQEWFFACNEAFCAAMERAGYQKTVGTLTYNSTGSWR
jgi:hypothetical protein